jgi:predicted  nucleic acid-binding Zn-ribbon protein
MLFLNRLTTLTLITVSFGLLLSSCGDGKMPQCNKLTETANKLKTVAAPKDAADLSLLADRIESARANLQKVDLQDSKLKEHQAKLLTIYSDTSRILKDKSKAASTRDTAALKKANQAIEEIVTKENSLVDEINKYCQ